MEMVNYMKQEVQNLEDEREMAIARMCFVRVQLEGERSTQYFCKMNKKFQAKAQFEDIHLDEVDQRGKEVMKVIWDQEEIEKEVRKFYSNLYSEGKAHVDKDVIIRNIESVTKIDEEDAKKLDIEITEEKVSSTLKNTKNNIAPGPGGLGGHFTKCSGNILSKML